VKHLKNSGRSCSVSTVRNSAKGRCTGPVRWQRLKARKLRRFARSPAVKAWKAQKIAGEAKKLAMDQGVSIKTEILEGDAADAIINAAKRLGSDLIIGGTRARSGIDKAIFGSIMGSVILNASCPVLVVK
jgi:nucleotide-binding universal stress UspA family protein